MAGEVVSGPHLEPLRLEQCGRAGLAGADLDAGDAARREQPPDLGREPAIVVEAVRAGEQRLLRLPARNIARELGAGQEGTVRPLFEAEGFVVRTRNDLAGRARCLILSA